MKLKGVLAQSAIQSDWECNPGEPSKTGVDIKAHTRLLPHTCALGSPFAELGVSLPHPAVTY